MRNQSDHLMVCYNMNARELDAEITVARVAYFHAADELLNKISLQFGEGPDGLRNLLNRRPKTVDNSGDIQPGKD